LTSAADAFPDQGQGRSRPNATFFRFDPPGRSGEHVPVVRRSCTVPRLSRATRTTDPRTNTTACRRPRHKVRPRSSKSFGGTDDHVGAVTTTVASAAALARLPRIMIAAPTQSAWPAGTRSVGHGGARHRQARSHQREGAIPLARLRLLCLVVSAGAAAVTRYLTARAAQRPLDAIQTGSSTTARGSDDHGQLAWARRRCRVRRHLTDRVRGDAFAIRLSNGYRLGG